LIASANRVIAPPVSALPVPETTSQTLAASAASDPSADDRHRGVRPRVGADGVDEQQRESREGEQEDGQ